MLFKMMCEPGAKFIFKIATEEWEFEQIHELNYRTFVEEIPQHEASDSLRRVDVFHEENIYVIALLGREVVGMLALRAERPFSLDQKLSDLDDYLPQRGRILEIRLLAVEKEYRGLRGGRILAGLIGLLRAYGGERGYDLAIISGTTRQLQLYRHMGFVAFGPLVGTEEARFQPMYVSLEEFDAHSQKFLLEKKVHTDAEG